MRAGGVVNGEGWNAASFYSTNGRLVAGQAEVIFSIAAPALQGSLILDGKPGADAKPYQEKQLRNAIQQIKP